MPYPASVLGQYTITVNAQAGCSTDSVSFKLIVGDCSTSQLDVFALSWTDDEYYIYDDQKSLQWNFGSTSTGLSACGDVTWTLTKSDGSPIDASIFTEDFTGQPKTLDIYTEDILHIGVHEFTTTVAYTNQPNVLVSTNWQIELKGCTTSTLDISASIWVNEIVIVSDPA